MAVFESIQKKIISFQNERDWAQFRNPKNLAEPPLGAPTLTRSADSTIQNGVDFEKKELIISLPSCQDGNKI